MDNGGNLEKTMRDAYLDTSVPFGHERVLFCLLVCASAHLGIVRISVGKSMQNTLLTDHTIPFPISTGTGTGTGNGTGTGRTVETIGDSGCLP